MRGIPVSRYVIHEHYDKRSVENDIALLRLRYRMKLGSGTAVTAACLPDPFGDSDALTGHHAVVTGWGTKSFSKNNQSRTSASPGLSVIQSLSRGRH